MKYYIFMANNWKFNTKSFIQVVHTFIKNKTLIILGKLVYKYNVIAEMNSTHR